MEQRTFSHQFLVPAYGRSPYLRECLTSLRNQKVASPILISTSTPFADIHQLAEEFNAELYLHSPNRGIAHDWNTGLGRTRADWITIAHQDDIYLPDYSLEVLSAIDAFTDGIMAFTDYAEIAADGSVKRMGGLLKIKQALLHAGFLGRKSISDPWSKTNLLRFGSPIPCPSVTMRRGETLPVFETEFKLNMDWAAWLEMSKAPGRFIWVKKNLMLHRIHEDSETSDGIKAGYRTSEDLDLLCRIWPRPIARLIAKSYTIAYRSNSR